MKLDDFFGLDFKRVAYDTNKYLDMLSIKRKIENTGPVKRISTCFGQENNFTDLAKRQQALIYLKRLLSQTFLPHDKYHENKDINTATPKDRRYNAEERLLHIALSFATAKSYNKLNGLEFKPDTIQLRNYDNFADERYEKLRNILNNATKSVQENFDQEKYKLSPSPKACKPDKSFFAKLFK